MSAYRNILDIYGTQIAIPWQEWFFATHKNTGLCKQKMLQDTKGFWNHFSSLKYLTVFYPFKILSMCIKHMKFLVSILSWVWVNSQNILTVKVQGYCQGWDQSFWVLLRFFCVFFYWVVFCLVSLFEVFYLGEK